MKGMLVFRPYDEDDTYQYDFTLNEEDTDYKIFISTSLDESFLDIISNPKDLKDSIQFLMDLEIDPDVYEIYERCINDINGLLNNAEYIVFNYDIEKVHEYVESNPILKTKKIVLQTSSDLDPSMIDRVKSLFGEDATSIYFDVSENQHIISFNEYCQTIDAIEKIVNDVNRFDLSPMEKIMYVYDIVRNRIYVAEGDNEEDYLSRDLSSCLLGEKIVCLGYARIFKTILDRLGIKSHKVYLNSTNTAEEGHARNEIYIKDDKYGIDGVYFFDATWDSKKSADDNSYLLTYRCFARTKEQMDVLDRKQLIDKYFPYFSSDIAEEFRETPLDDVSKDMVQSINHISRIMKGKSLINRIGLPPFGVQSFRPNKDEVLRELTPLVEYFNKPLSADVLLSVLYNVRKIEYYSNPQMYPFSLEDFYKIVLNSVWTFNATPEESFMLLLSDRDERNRIKGKQLMKHSKETGLEKKIEQVRLTKTLRMITDKNK